MVRISLPPPLQSLSVKACSLLTPRLFLAGITIILFVLSSCGSSDSGGGSSDTKSTVNANPQGIWKGNTTYKDTGKKYNALALVSKNNDYIGLASDDKGSLYEYEIGTVSTIGNKLTGSGYSATIAIGNTYAEAKFAATVTEKKTISWDNSKSSGSVSYDVSYEIPSTLTTLEGTYSVDTYDVTIDSAGQLIGKNKQGGCESTGTVETIDTNYNMFNVKITLKNCNPASPSAYKGLMAISYENKVNKGITLFATSLNNNTLFYLWFSGQKK